MHIIRPRTELILPARVAYSGRYRMQVYRPDGRCRLDSGWFSNIITNSGLDYRGGTTGSQFFEWCHVGSGSTTPSATDTGLASFVASTDNDEENTYSAQSSSPYYASFIKRFRFSAGAAAGNLSEVGVGPASSAGAEALYSRALIVDSGGSPTTISVLSDEILDVTFESRIEPPTTDTLLNITDSGPAGTSHSITLRAAKVTKSSVGTTDGWNADDDPLSFDIVSGDGAYDGAIGAITGEPSGTFDARTSNSTDAYSGGSYERTGEIFFGLNEANFDIKSILFGTSSGGSFQAEFDPVIPKDNTKVLTIGLKVSWARA